MQKKKCWHSKKCFSEWSNTYATSDVRFIPITEPMPIVYFVFAMIDQHQHKSAVELCGFVIEWL